MGQPHRRTTEITRERYLKSVDADARIVEAVLGYPAIDYDGDWVQPDGGDWSDYPANPIVNWNHGIPIGRGEVRLMKGKIEGETWNLPIGTTQFFQSAQDLRGLDLTRLDANDRPIGKWDHKDCLDAADDAWRMVADDVARGVSIEFRPLGTKGVDYHPTGKKSLLSGRPSYRFERWKGLGYAHALQQKNPGAMTLSPAIEKAIRIAETGKHPGGKAVNPLILKAFASLKDIPRSTSVRVEKAVPKAKKKAYPDDDTDMDPLADPMAELDDAAAVDEADVDTDLEADGLPDMKPTPMAFAMAVQDMLDSADRLEEALGGPMEHESGMERLKQHVESIRALAEELLSDARTMFPDADLDAPEGTPDEDAGLPVTDDGALLAKAFKKGFPVRFRASDLTPAGSVKKSEQTLSPAQERILAAGLSKLNRKLSKVSSRLTTPGR